MNLSEHGENYKCTHPFKDSANCRKHRTRDDFREVIWGMTNGGDTHPLILLLKWTEFVSFLPRSRRCFNFLFLITKIT